MQAISTCARVLRRQLAAELASYGINDNEFFLLWHLRGGQPTAQNELLSLLAISPAQLSMTIDRMVTRQLVQTVRCADDRRRQNIQTTDQAQKLLCVILASDEGIREHFNNRVTSVEQADLLKLVSRLSCDPKTLRVFDPQTACQFEREAKA